MSVERPQRITVIADEVVSVRPLDPGEVLALRSLIWRAPLRGLPQVLFTALGFATFVALSVVDSGDFRKILVGSGLVVGGLFAANLRPWLGQLRRARLLLADRACAQMLVLESPRGRCERLAVSGLLWRQGDAIAPWRTEE